MERERGGFLGREREEGMGERKEWEEGKEGKWSRKESSELKERGERGEEEEREEQDKEKRMERERLRGIEVDWKLELEELTRERIERRVVDNQ